MANLENLVMRDTRSNQPAAGIAGRLYYVTDENVLERDNGSSWENCESAAGSGIPSSGWIDATAETWTYASADDPTFTFTISGDKTNTYQAGQRIKLTQTTVKYFIITKVEYSAPNTTVTIYGGTDYDLANAEISNNYYSPVRAPLGFPLDPSKWTVEVLDTSSRSQGTPTQNTWYNLGSVAISIPIGCWRVSYSVFAGYSDSSSGSWNIYCSLSTANNTESDADFTAGVSVNASLHAYSQLARDKFITLTSKTSYYLNSKTSVASLDNIYNRGDLAKTIIRAVCAYL